MKFKVLSLSYLFGELVPEGAIYDFPDDKLPRNTDGSVNFGKLSQLELVEKVEVLEAKNADEGKKNLTDEERYNAILDAIEKLDPTIDSHWTKAGLPDVNTIKELVGFEVTRKEIDTVAPDYLRPAE